MVVISYGCDLHTVCHGYASKSPLIGRVVWVSLNFASQGHIPILFQLIQVVFKKRLNAISDNQMLSQIKGWIDNCSVSESKCVVVVNLDDSWSPLDMHER